MRSYIAPAAVLAAVALALGCDGRQPPTRHPSRILSQIPPRPAVQLSVQPSSRLFPAEAEATKRIRLDAGYSLVDLGTAGKLGAWCFGGTVPGPTVRLRVGDRVQWTMTNRSDEALQALRLPSVAAHSIKLGGVLMDREDEERAIGPGQSLEMEFIALEPGVHLYRSGLADKQGQASGMFGMLVIEPPDGFAPAVARELAVVESELYARPDPVGQRIDKTPLLLADPEALRLGRPSRLGYNGLFAPGARARLFAEPGERVRLFVLNAAVTSVARFQVPGLPFERVWPPEVMGAQPSGLAPVLLAPGQGAIIELTIPRKGRFPFSDAQLAGRGLAGLIDASQGEPEPKVPVIRGPLTPAARRELARALFTERCVSCHEPPGGTMRLAPDLTGVAQRHNPQWLVKWLSDPPRMQAEDGEAQELMRKWNNLPMPDMALSPEQVGWLTEYLRSYQPGASRTPS
jgi:nitrite reductase (NO-forming)